MSFPRYSKYKASGVEWLGDVPEGWEAWKLTHAFEKIGSGTTPKTDIREYYDGGTNPWLNTGDLNDGKLTDCANKITSRALSDHTTLRIYPAGSVVIAMYGATIGKLAILKFSASVNQACCVFSGQRKIDYKFLFFWLLGYRPQIINLASGGGQPNVNQEILRGLRIPCPDLTEQTAIAEFLDRETAKIDDLVAEQRRLMELLKEKRQAVISHAVTKGLNPNAPMKSSGIEWLGDVPEGWEVTNIKRVATIRYGIGEPPTYYDNGTPLIRATNVHAGEIFNEGLVFVDPIEIPEKRIVWLSAGDIIVVRSGAYTGDSAIIPAGFGPCIAGFDMVLTCRSANPEFLQFALLSKYLKGGQIDLQKMRAAQPHLNAEELGSCFFLLPIAEEQEMIVQFLKAEVKEYAALTAESQRAIDLLQERRTALISAAVTGQIDVRQQPRN